MSFRDELAKSLFEALKWICGTEKGQNKKGEIVDLPITGNAAYFLREMETIFHRDTRGACDYIQASYQNILFDMSKDFKTKEKIEACTVASRMACLIHAAESKLPLGSSAGYWYVIPRGETLTVSLSYQGMECLAKRNHDIEYVDAQIIFTGYEFVNLAIDDKGLWSWDKIKVDSPFHKVKVDFAEVEKTRKDGGKYKVKEFVIDFGNILGVAVYVHFKDGRIVTDFVNTDFLMDSYNCSESKTSEYSPYAKAGFAIPMLKKIGIRTSLGKFMRDDPVYKRIVGRDEALTMDYEEPAKLPQRAVSTDFINQITGGNNGVDEHKGNSANTEAQKGNDCANDEKGQAALFENREAIHDEPTTDVPIP